VVRRYDDTPDGKLDLAEFTELIRDVEAGVVRSRGRDHAYPACMQVLTTALAPLSPQVRSPGRDHAYPVPARVSAAFDAFDADQSGYIDHRELRAALRHYGYVDYPLIAIDYH
jgi:hypothetical protein